MAPFNFQDFLTDLDDGRFHEQLCTLWPKVIQSVMETGKKGSLTITLSANKEGRMAIVTSIASIKTPAPATEKTMFFVGEDGVTTRHDPTQLPLRHVNLKPTEPIRLVKTEGPAPEATAEAGKKE